MAFPSTAKLFTEAMDPYDVVDFGIDCSSLLRPGENIASWSVAALPEATLLGLTIQSGAYAPFKTGNIIYVWLGILLAEQSNTAFAGNGVTLPLEVSITTDSAPARKRQRTVAVTVVQQ